MDSFGFANDTVKDWLEGEHDYQFGKNRITHKAKPIASIAYIMGTEIPNKWDRFQTFSDSARALSDKPLFLQASQQLLKACGASRGALVWDYVAKGQTIEDGSQSSWRDLEDYYNSLTDASLPVNDLLSVSLEDALSPASVEPSDGVYDIKPVFFRLCGLAITHLLEQYEQIGDMAVPSPGVASGDIQV